MIGKLMIILLQIDFFFFTIKVQKENKKGKLCYAGAHEIFENLGSKLIKPSCSHI